MIPYGICKIDLEEKKRNISYDLYIYLLYSQNNIQKYVYIYKKVLNSKLEIKK